MADKSESVDKSELPPPTKCTTKKGRKFKYRFLCETNLHNVRREQIFYYILSLHKRIRSLLRICKRYREKILKLENVYATEKNEAKGGKVESKTGKNEPDKNPTEADSQVDGESKPTDSKSSTNNFIADIKNAAHQAQNDAGFIYEPTSGLYYDSRTGYYYNAEHGLYYDGNNGCYYSYNQAENKFEFHSQVYSTAETAQDEQNEQTDRSKRKRQKSNDFEPKVSRKAKKLADIDSELKEDGEISDDNDSDEDVGRHSPVRRHSPPPKDIVYEIDDDTCSSSNSSDNGHRTFSDIAKQYPPSLRVIVQETNIKKLKIGELFLITYTGGSLGREGKHDVIIPDINCSKYHLKFVFDDKHNGYNCIDLGSRNGTLINGKRMSNAKQESEPMQVVHGSVLQIGQTKLLCHIHDGHTTCGQCEPGLLTSSAYTESLVASSSSSNKPGTINDDHKRQLKNLKKRYGLQDEKYTAQKMDVKNDRAEQRRQAVGSSCEHEKTKAASLDASISSENKGFKMLAKLGWSEGQALGKNSDGLLEPIPLKSNDKTKGLGCGESASNVYSAKQKHKTRIWEKTHQRYHASDAAVDIFKECSDESD